MAYTRVSIISIAIGLLGNKPINSLDNPSDIVGAADQAFDFFLPEVLSSCFWRFATKIQQLSQLVGAPIVTDWRFRYSLPGDYLKTVREYPQNYQYEIYGNEIYSNLDNPLYLEYSYIPDISIWPGYFAVYYAYELACYLALSNAQNIQYYSLLDPKRELKRCTALATDAQNRPQTAIASSPIISTRAVGAYDGTILGPVIGG